MKELNDRAHELQLPMTRIESELSEAWQDDHIAALAQKREEFVAVFEPCRLLLAGTADGKIRQYGSWSGPSACETLARMSQGLIASHHLPHHPFDERDIDWERMLDDVECEVGDLARRSGTAPVKDNYQPLRSHLDAFHRATLAVYADLGATIAVLTSQPDLRGTLVLLDEIAARHMAPESGDPDLVANLKHAVGRLRSSLATVEDIRQRHRAVRWGLGRGRQVDRTWGGLIGSSYHDVMVGAATALLEVPKPRQNGSDANVIRHQVIRDGASERAWRHLRENLEHEYDLASQLFRTTETKREKAAHGPEGLVTAPHVNGETSLLGAAPAFGLTREPMGIFDALDDIFTDVSHGTAEAGLAAHDTFFGQRNLHGELASLASRRGEFQQQFPGPVRDIADFAVTSGHEAIAFFAERVAGHTKVRRDAIPRIRRELESARQAGRQTDVARHEASLWTTCEEFAASVLQALRGWSKHRAWMRRSIEAEAASPAVASAGSGEDAQPGRGRKRGAGKVKVPPVHVDERDATALKRATEWDESGRAWTLTDLANDLGCDRSQLTGKTSKGGPKRCPMFSVYWEARQRERQQRQMNLRSSNRTAGSSDE